MRMAPTALASEVRVLVEVTLRAEAASGSAEQESGKRLAAPRKTCQMLDAMVWFGVTNVVTYSEQLHVVWKVILAAKCFLSAH
jgi:hypothetical protein